MAAMNRNHPEITVATGSGGVPPLALYVHLPWCLRKCPYCDFNSHTAGEAPPKGRYLAALIADLAREAFFAGERPIESVFLGGGTPSLFTAAEIGELLDAVAGSCRLVTDAEITMEANPGVLECDRLADYRAAGVNRLSLGAQSFDPNMLRRLGRVHGPGEIFAAFEEAERAGVSRINLDLLYALPGQTAEMALADIEQAVRLSPPHISWYQLTLEPNTVFHARPPADLPDEEVCEVIETECLSRLVAAGYERYETSAFAKPGQLCRHNLN
jgi:oxygen-independent coproporphyrinogen-3 oxidase